jgi:predicted dehydrogenase
MEFESGCVANLTASRVSTERVRKLRFFQPRQYISIDYTRQDLLVFTVDAARAAGSATATGPASLSKAAMTGASPNPGIGMEKPTVINEEPLKAELRSFIAAVRERTPPIVALEDGRRALATALDILSAIQAHSRRLHLDRAR